MHPTIQLNLPLILFLPWFLIIGTLFWCYPRRPRDAARIAFDTVALALSVAAFVFSVHVSHDNAGTWGRIWPQVLATSVGYGVFLAAMTIALLIRRAWLKRRLPRA